MRKIAIMNQKGGVGKTTTSANLAHALALFGQRVLVIDADPQAHLSASLGIHKQLCLPGLDAVLLEDEPVQNVVLQMRRNLSVLPAGMRLGEVEFLKQGGSERGFLLEKKLAVLEDEYDFVFIDCPPSTGLIGMNCILAVDEMLVPVTCDFLSVHGMTRLLSIVSYIEKELHRSYQKRFVITRYQGHKILNLETRNKLEQTFSGEMLNTAIVERRSIMEAPALGKTIFDYESKGQAAENFRELAQDLLHDRVVGNDELRQQAG